MKEAKADSAVQARKVAVIGDIHGCIDEAIALYKKLEWMTLDEIWGAGDLVDRGPDSGAVVQFFRENNIPSVRGNHEDSIIKAWEHTHRAGKPVSNPDKARTVSQLKPEDYEWLKTLPKLHVFDDTKLIIVHGGLWPGLSLYQQPWNVIRAQMIHPKNVGVNRWWGPDAIKQGKEAKSEVDNRAEGYERWYRLYDHEYDCVFGHSVFNQPLIHQNEGSGKCVGVDTGSCFGGMVTAGIFDGGDPVFLSVKSKRVYFELSRNIIRDD